MHRLELSLAAAIALGACAAADVAPQNDPAPRSAGLERALSGEAAYGALCADCHEEGIDGAPATGDTAAWAARSPLWSAVLVEHARRGYLKMPARGGSDVLSDADVQAATEHMLSLTYPDRPRAY